MKATIRRQPASRKRRTLRRIKNQPSVEIQQPVMTASIHDGIADRVRAVSPGGIRAIHPMARKLGLVHDIDENLRLLKRHTTYFESDHVRNIAYNLPAAGSRLDHLEGRRYVEVSLDALGARRLPDPTTAVAFCRCFTEGDVEQWMAVGRGAVGCCGFPGRVAVGGVVADGRTRPARPRAPRVRCRLTTRRSSR